MSEENKQASLEENFEKIEEIISLLASDDIPLEEAFRAYTSGLAVLKQCNDQIDRVEKQVLKLSEEGMPEEFDYGKTGI